MAVAKKTFVALVEEDHGRTVTTPVPEVPATTGELQTKLKAIRTDAKTTRQALVESRKKDKEEGKESTRGFKRPQWEPANQMVVLLGDREKTIDVELEDTWVSVKELACEKFNVDAARFSLTVKCVVPETKKVRKQDVPLKVGHFCVWDAHFELVEKVQSKAKSESSSSSSDSNN